MPSTRAGGFGRFAVEAVAAEARRRGAERLTTFYLDEAGGPGPFYARLGFRPDGRHVAGQVVVHLDLSSGG
jgi:diamine N-acetyltransferase